VLLARTRHGLWGRILSSSTAVVRTAQSNRYALAAIRRHRCAALRVGTCADLCLGQARPARADPTPQPQQVSSLIQQA
jgi:hypothetical protein